MSGTRSDLARLKVLLMAEAEVEAIVKTTRRTDLKETMVSNAEDLILVCVYFIYRKPIRTRSVLTLLGPLRNTANTCVNPTVLWNLHQCGEYFVSESSLRNISVNIFMYAVYIFHIKRYSSIVDLEKLWYNVHFRSSPCTGVSIIPDIDSRPHEISQLRKADPDLTTHNSRCDSS